MARDYSLWDLLKDIPDELFVHALGHTDNFTILKFLSHLPRLRALTLLIKDHDDGPFVSHYFPAPGLDTVHFKDFQPTEHCQGKLICLFEFCHETPVDSAKFYYSDRSLFNDYSFAFRILPLGLPQGPYIGAEGEDGKADYSIWVSRFPLHVKVTVLDRLKRSPLHMLLAELSHYARTMECSDYLWWGWGLNSNPFGDCFRNETLIFVCITGKDQIPELNLPQLSHLQIHFYRLVGTFGNPSRVRGRIEALNTPLLTTLRVFYFRHVPKFCRVISLSGAFDSTFELTDIRAAGGNRIDTIEYWDDVGTVCSGFEFLKNFSLLVLRGVHPVILEQFEWKFLRELFFFHCAVPQNGPPFVIPDLSAPKLEFLTFISTVPKTHFSPLLAPNLSRVKLEFRAPIFHTGGVLSGKPKLKFLTLNYNIVHRNLDTDRYFACGLGDKHNIGELKDLIMIRLLGYTELNPKFTVSQKLLVLELSVDHALLVNDSKVFRFNVSGFSRLRMLKITCYPVFAMQEDEKPETKLEEFRLRHRRNQMPFEFHVSSIFARVVLNGDLLTGTDDRKWTFNGGHGPLSYRPPVETLGQRAPDGYETDSDIDNGNDVDDDDEDGDENVDDDDGIDQLRRRMAGRRGHEVGLRRLGVRQLLNPEFPEVPLQVQIPADHVAEDDPNGEELRELGALDIEDEVMEDSD